MPLLTEATNITEATDNSNTLRRVRVPGEDSCLFLSVALLINGGQLRSERARLMRKIVAEEVWSNQEKYDALLEQSSEDYCDWIMKSWMEVWS